MSFPTTLPKEIRTIEDLHNYLLIATQLEHATLPVYLTALYSINPKTNSDAYHIIRVVAIEEMLHLAQAANILIAVGGEPKLTDPGFIPKYPTPLPDGENDFKVDQQRFSPAALEAFLKIERPDTTPAGKKWVEATPERTAARAQSGGVIPACVGDSGEVAHFYSIGDFYQEISDGINRLYNDPSVGPEKLFSGKDKPQAPADAYYSGGGELIVVKDLQTVQDAIDRIIYQGEGKDGGKYTKQGELSHYYRFNQLKLGAYYKDENDKDDKPTGPELKVNCFDVVPVKTNIAIEDFDQAPELKKIVEKFEQTYADFLETLQKAFTGQPELFQQQAVPKMFQLRNEITQIINNPLPGHPGLNAAPLFKIFKKS